MESEGVPIPSVSSPPPPVASDDHLDVSPAGSPDLSDHDHQPQPPALPSSDQPPAILTDDLRDKIIKQVEYYFSDENLPSDKYLMKHMSKDKGGYVPIGVVASFRKMKKLTKDISLIATALRESSLLVVSPNGKKVKRLHPLPPAEVKDPMLCTVVVENLPNDHSVENLQRIFGEAGKIQKIVIRDPHDARDSRKLTTAEKLLSTKLHALVEYDTVEAAERAVSSLNDEQDWRYGLRVKLLKKKTKTEGKADGKAETRKKVWQEVDEEKNSTGQASNSVVEEHHCSNDHHDDSHDEEEGHFTKEWIEENPQKDKTGEHHQEHNVQRNRNRGRGRRQKYNGSNGHGHVSTGHGTPPNSHHIGHGHGTPPNSHHFETSKPPPGPKMPDGTRGFTLGRGRPLQSHQN